MIIHEKIYLTKLTLPKKTSIMRNRLKKYELASSTVRSSYIKVVSNSVKTPTVLVNNNIFNPKLIRL